MSPDPSQGLLPEHFAHAERQAEALNSGHSAVNLRLDSLGFFTGIAGHSGVFSTNLRHGSALAL